MSDTLKSLNDLFAQTYSKQLEEIMLYGNKSKPHVKLSNFLSKLGCKEKYGEDDAFGYIYAGISAQMNQATTTIQIKKK